MSDIPVDVGSAASTPSGSGPCEAWATTEDVCNCGTTDADLLEPALTVASWVLFNLSARRYPGLCEQTVRPTCECRASHRNLVLPGPIVEVIEVMIEGEVVDPSEYYVVDKRFIRRRSENATSPGWPCLSLEDDEPDRFSVTYVRGRVPPEAGKRAAARLACELAKSCDPDAECNLPQRVTSVSRQGIGLARALDPFDFLDSGKTGLYEVDLFLKAANPYGHKRPPSVWSPDISTRSHSIGT